MRRRRSDEFRQIVGAFPQILQIENAFGETTEKSQVTVLGDLAAWAKQRRRRIQFAAEREQLMLIAASPVQEQKRPLRRAGSELMSEIQRSSHAAKNSAIASTTRRCISGVSSG